MASKERAALTEPMFYVLMSFLRQEMCGIEITEFVEKKTGAGYALVRVRYTHCWVNFRTST